MYPTTWTNLHKLTHHMTPAHTTTASPADISPSHVKKLHVVALRRSGPRPVLAGSIHLDGGCETNKLEASEASGLLAVNRKWTVCLMGVSCCWLLFN